MKLKSITLSALLFLTVYHVTALNPSRTYKQTPDKYNMTFESHKVKTDDGAELNAWYFPAKTKTTNLILISHSGDGNMGDNLRQADRFVLLGYNVMMYDYRGYGESSEFEIDNNMYIYPHFQDDVKAMIDYCRKNFVQTFSLYGWGIGAGLSLGVGYNRPEVKSIIADTPFFSMEDLEKRFSGWDEPMEVPFAGYEKKHEPLFSLDSPPMPAMERIMLIIGNNDPLYKSADMKTLQAKQKKLISTIYEVNNTERKVNFLVDKEAYMSAIKKFL